jgi:hypothetical protein
MRLIAAMTVMKRTTKIEAEAAIYAVIGQTNGGASRGSG